MLRQVGNGIDSPKGDVCLLQSLRQSHTRKRCKHAADLGVQCRTVATALNVRGIPGVGQQIRVLQHQFTKIRPLPVVLDSYHHFLTVAAGISTVGRYRGVS